MRQEKIILLLVVIVVILSMLLITGVGYAVETGEINDNPLLTTQRSDFEVEFTGKPTYTGKGQAVLRLTGPTTATMNITGLKSVGDSVTAIFKIVNKSNDIYADINTRVTNTNTEYFKVTSELSKARIKSKNGVTTLEVTIELIKLPIYKTETTSICINIFANPEY